MPDPISFGRIAPPPEHWPAIAGQIASAPEPTDESPPPPKSLPLWRWRHPRVHAQLAGRGCCVGEAVADMLELNARRVDGSPAPPPLKVVPGVPAISPLWVYWIARQYSARQGRPLWGQDGAIVSDALMAVMEQGVIAWDAWPGTEANYRNYSDVAPPRSTLDAPRIKVRGECLRLTSTAQLAQYIGTRGLAVVAGTAWRSNQQTDRAGKFAWGGGSIGGHAYCLSAYDLPDDRLYVDNSWPGWGVWPADGAADADGNPLPRGYGFTGWARWTQAEMSPAALSSGQTEVIVVEDLTLGDGPTPPDPPQPDPTDPKKPDPPTPPPAPAGYTTYTGLLRSPDGRVLDAEVRVRELR